MVGVVDPCPGLTDHSDDRRSPEGRWVISVRIPSLDPASPEVVTSVGNGGIIICSWVPDACQCQ
jgi:hypothetical protein